MMETSSLKDTTVLLSKSKTNAKQRQCKRCFVITLSSIFVIVAIMIILIVTGTISNLFKTEHDNIMSGTFGKFSSYGGSPSNAQIVTYETNLMINESNILLLTQQCILDLGDGIAYSGYITVDDENHAYVAAASNVSKMNIDDCQILWTVNIADLLGYNSTTQKVPLRQVASLFKNSNGRTGVLFAAPSNRRVGISNNDPCWAIALTTNNGSLLWKTKLGEASESFGCRAHGFMVDKNNHFAFGGISEEARECPRCVPHMAITRGRMFKLDIDSGKIVDKWYPISDEKFIIKDANVSDPYLYRGISIWNIPAIINNYLVFGTGNLRTYPKYIEQCLLGMNNTLSMDNIYPFDACMQNRSQDSKFWKCMETDVYPSSFIILDKNTFELKKAIPLQGMDAWESIGLCGNVENGEYGCMRVQGPDADFSDLAAVATYINPYDKKIYGIASPKSGHLYVFEIPSGKTIIAKKVGIWSTGGGNQWGVAVDAENLIVIVSVTGGNGRYDYRSILADGTEICENTGSVHAISLRTGETIWQMFNPWGTINNCSDEIYDNYVDKAVNESCEILYGDSDDMQGNTINVIKPPINENEREQIQSNLMGKIVAPTMIVDNLVFIPTWSGDIFIHDLFTGRYIHTLQCPNRGEIKGGITVFEDRVLFYCGSDQIVSMKLKLYE
eukprot:413109_1